MAKVTDDVVEDALEQFNESHDGSALNREAYYEDFKFARMSEQWPGHIKEQRDLEARPVLTINKLPTIIQSVVNEARQSKSAIKVSPVDNGADVDSAEVIAGIVKSIERESVADIAYDSAIDQAVTGGFGFYRISIVYEEGDTFDTACRIERVPNALMVHWDTSSTKFDASDWRYAFISDLLNKDEYERKYPKGSMTPFEGDTRNDVTSQWINEDTIRVSEYWLREAKTRNLIQLEVPNPQTGQMDIRVVREDDLPELARQFFEAGGIDSGGGTDRQLAQAYMEASGATEKRRREAEYFTVKRRIINGVEVLEEDDWPGSTIPICPVWGSEVFFEGRRYFFSLIRDAKDPQRMFNYWRTASTELVALAPKAPWIGQKGFVPKGQEAKWASANTRNHAYLEYEPGEAPRREPFAGVPAGALQETMNANDDIKATTGIFDPSLGASAPEKSGVAIKARQRQGDVLNFHFIDNANRAKASAGKILVEIIPHVYSMRQTVRILGEDEKEKVIKLTQEAGGAKQGELYNLSVGRYDVAVASGPSYSTQREETRETLIEIMRQVPDAAAYLGDVLLEHMDFVGADKVAKRLKSLLPPEVQKAESQDVTGSDNPEAAALKQQMDAKDQQMQQMQQAVMAEIEKLKKENEALKADKSMEARKVQTDAGLKERELALKEAEAAKSNETKLTIEREKMASQANENDLDRRVDLAKALIDRIAGPDPTDVIDQIGELAVEDAKGLANAESD